MTLSPHGTGLVVLTLLISLSFVAPGCSDSSSSRNNLISSDPGTIAAGKQLFRQDCEACHAIEKNGIGPALAGITEEVSVDWLQHFIRNAQQIISSGDSRADSLVKKYKGVMPSFSGLKDEEINSLIAYLHTQPSSLLAKKEAIVRGITDPIREKIHYSGLMLNVKPFAALPSTVTNNSFPKTRITKLDYEPQSGDLFLNDLRGIIYKMRGTKWKVYLDMRKAKPKFIAEPGLATGLGSFAFHPEFFKSGLFYTTHTESPGSGKADFAYNDSIKAEVQWVLSEWKVSDPAADSLTGESRELLRINMITGMHGVQEIAFDPLAKRGDKDYGLLYMGIGDGGSVENGFPAVVHGKDKIYGTLIRIDPSGRNSLNGRYGIPPDNPFVGDTGHKTIPEIYAYGFRNPHRITWTKSGDLLVSHVGQAHIEALDLIKPGQDYGWPAREGSFRVYGNDELNNIDSLPSDDSNFHYSYPLAAFDHDEGNAISGGYEYTGNAIPVLKDKFVFGDIPSGRLFYIDERDIRKKHPVVIHEAKISINGVPRTLKELSGPNRVDLHLGRDAHGGLYLLTKVDGKIYKIENARIKLN